MKSLRLCIFFLLITIYSSPTLVLAHDSSSTTNHTHNTEYYLCNGKRASRFYVQFVKMFAKARYAKCVIQGRENSLDTTEYSPSSSPSSTPIPSPTGSHTNTAIPTNSPTSSITPTNTSTSRPTPSPTPSTTPSNTSSQPSQFWHSVGAHDGLNTHEHGDAPPSWADDFSLKNFGHKVMFGGDEATPNENILKHQAYKGFLMRQSNVDIFIRYHSMSTPHDRSSALHSYEVYAKDSSSNVSFWQGWIFHGYPEHRDQRMSRRNEQPGYDPLNGITWPGRNQFIISGSDIVDWKKYLTCEQWYGHGGLWSWDLSITICGATTHYSVDEHLTDVNNPSTWKPTGALGGSRRLEVSHYGPSNPLVGGENLPMNKWFCVKKQPNEDRLSGRTPTWTLGGAVNSPSSCEPGFLPQYVADTFPKKGVYFETGNTDEKDFDTTGVTLPN